MQARTEWGIDCNTHVESVRPWAFICPSSQSELTTEPGAFCQPTPCWFPWPGCQIEVRRGLSHPLDLLRSSKLTPITPLTRHRAPLKHSSRLGCRDTGREADRPPIPVTHKHTRLWYTVEMARHFFMLDCGICSPNLGKKAIPITNNQTKWQTGFGVWDWGKGSLLRTLGKICMWWKTSHRKPDEMPDEMDYGRRRSNGILGIPYLFKVWVLKDILNVMMDCRVTYFGSRSL